MRSAQLSSSDNPKEKLRMIATLQQTIKTKDRSVYNKNIKYLRSSVTSKELIDNLLKRKEKVFYCELPYCNFSSLSRDYC
jgi:hypothetical protein